MHFLNFVSRNFALQGDLCHRQPSEQQKNTRLSKQCSKNLEFNFQFIHLTENLEEKWKALESCLNLS